MREGGFVRLDLNPHHRRAMLVTMTERGEAAYRAAGGRQEGWADAIAADLSLESIEVAGVFLRDLQSRLDALAASAARSPTLRRKTLDMPKFIEMDHTVTLADQLKDEGGPLILVNTFVVPPENADRLLAVWATDAAIMKRQPGFISTQLHRGIAGGGTFLNYAVWETTGLRAAFSNPEFQAQLTHYPESVTVSPHLFRQIAVPGICAA